MMSVLELSPFNRWGNQPQNDWMSWQRYTYWGTKERIWTQMIWHWKLYSIIMHTTLLVDRRKHGMYLLLALWYFCPVKLFWLKNKQKTLNSWGYTTCTKLQRKSMIPHAQEISSSAPQGNTQPLWQTFWTKDESKTWDGGGNVIPLR